MFNTMTIRAFLAIALSGLMGQAAAQEATVAAQPPPKSAAAERDIESGAPKGPPPGAYQACVGKTAGSRSEFTDPNSELLQGVCQEDEQGRMVLRPDRPGEMPAGKHRGPPPEAYAACTGKSLGAEAQFVSPRGETIAGRCEMEGSRLVLRPNSPPPREGKVQAEQPVPPRAGGTQEP